MVFKLTSFDKLLERHSSSASSPDQKTPDIFRNVYTSRDKKEFSNEYRILTQNEVMITNNQILFLYCV